MYPDQTTITLHQLAKEEKKKSDQKVRLDASCELKEMKK